MHARQRVMGSIGIRDIEHIFVANDDDDVLSLAPTGEHEGVIVEFPGDLLIRCCSRVVFDHIIFKFVRLIRNNFFY